MADDLLADLNQAIVDGQIEKTGQLTREAIDAGIAGKDILQKALIPGIREIGRLFGEGEAYLPELIVTGRSMDAAMAHLGPLFEHEETMTRGKFLIGTVKGDLHDIGKNIVTMMLKGSGWEVEDLGLDVPPDRFCEAVKSGDYDVLGMSALLTTTMDNIVLTIKALSEAGLRDTVKIMIGGAPVTQDFADFVGADAWGEDGWDAVVKAEEMILA